MRELKKKRIQISLVLFIAMVLCSLSGCGSSDHKAATEEAVSYATDDLYSSDTNEMATEDAVAEEAAEEEGTADSGKVSSNRKLIKTVDLTVETTEFDSLITNLVNKVDALGGYIENSEVYGGGINEDSIRDAHYTVRVPSDKLDGFVESVSEAANIIRKSENVEDVTLQYVDTQSKKEALEVEKDRLMLLLEEADSIETIIALESRLSEVRYELETMESKLRTYDNLVDYSTVYINISEVRIYTPKEPESVWERIGSGFLNSLEGVADDLVDLFVGIVVSIPYLVVWAVIIIVCIFIFKKIVNGTKKRKEKARGEEVKTEMPEIKQNDKNDGK